MTEKKLYTCDVCHTDYANKEDAIKCEKEHFKITKIKDSRYQPHIKYPNKIEISFEDGTTKWYRTEVY